MRIAGFNVPLNTFLGYFGDGGPGGVTAASASIVAAVSAEAISPLPSATPQCVRWRVVLREHC